MKKILIVTAVFFLFSLTQIAHSQVSGYMGKCNVLKLGLFMKSSFLMPNKNGKSGYFSFNDRYSLEYERVITRNKSIQFRVTSFETYYKTNQYIWGDSDDIGNPLLKMSCKSFGADFIVYRPLHIAPLGVYSSFGIDVIFSKAAVDTALVNSYSNDGMNYLNYKNTEITTTHLGLNLKSGVKQIFFDCLSIDFNFQMGIIFSGNITGEAEMGDNAEEYIKGRIGNRLWGHYLWGVNCSIGYLF